MNKNADQHKKPDSELQLVVSTERLKLVALFGLLPDESFNYCASMLLGVTRTAGGFQEHEPIERLRTEIESFLKNQR